MKLRIIARSLIFGYLIYASLASSQTCSKISRTIPEPLLNTQLQASKIAVFETWNDFNCLQKCFRIKGCDGVNTKAKSKDSVICEELSSQAKNSQNQVLSKEGWKYYDLKLPSVCNEGARKLCSETQGCIDDAVEGHRCVELTNLAYQKATTQSSTALDGSSSRAVDGNKNTDFFQLSCTHTAEDSLPWWNVDFGSNAEVYSVSITNRGDCCSERLEGLDILVGSETASNIRSNSICQENLSMKNIKTKLFRCKKWVTGRYLYIVNPPYQPVSMCEVEVYGILKQQR